MTNDVIIQNLKQDLHSQMNGAASAIMREAGLRADYRTNFGVELPRLRTMADEIIAQSFSPQGDSDSDKILILQAKLAGQLWKESVRECRIIALMIMPSQLMDSDLVEVWAEQIHTVELAQLAAFLLFSRVPSISSNSFQWIASNNVLTQILGYYTLIHLLRNHQLSHRSLLELHDQANSALHSDDIQLSMAASRLLSHLDSEQLHPTDAQ